MGISLDGLASGLDTTALISQLMQVESLPRTQLQTRLAATQSRTTDLQTLNTRIAALATAAKAAAAPRGLSAFSASSTSTAVTATATGFAAAATLDISVRAVASGQTSVTAAMSDWDGSSLTIETSSGRVQVDPSGTGIDALVSAIAKAGAGVTATKVSAGSAPDGTPLFRLQLTSTTTGADAAFSMHRGDIAAVDAGTATDLLAQPGAAGIRAAADAEVVLWEGTAAEQTVRSSSNTFTGLLTGVDVTVSAVTAEPATLTVAPDGAAAASTMKGVTDALAAAFSLISAKSAASMTTDADGNQVSKLGSFTGDSTVRAAQTALLNAATLPVDGVSPSAIGISYTKDGVLQFDPDAFAAAYAQDPERTQRLATAFADRVATAATVVSDPYAGTLTSAIKTQQDFAGTLTDQIDSWTRRLEQREATLKSTYAALEVQMSSLNSQSSWLSSQIAALTPKASS